MKIPSGIAVSQPDGLDFLEYRIQTIEVDQFNSRACCRWQADAEANVTCRTSTQTFKTTSTGLEITSDIRTTSNGSEITSDIKFQL